MYPSRCGFYSKFFIYKQTGLSQLFIVLLALILTFMSLLLTYHCLVYTSVPACALELGPREPWPGALARSGGSRRHSVSGRRGRQAISSHPSLLVATLPTGLGAAAPAPRPSHGLRQGSRKIEQKGAGGKDRGDPLWRALPAWVPAAPPGRTAPEQHWGSRSWELCSSASVGFFFFLLWLISWQPGVPCSDNSAKFGFRADKQPVPSSILASKAWRAGRRG